MRFLNAVGECLNLVLGLVGRRPGRNLFRRGKVLYHALERSGVVFGHLVEGDFAAEVHLINIVVVARAVFGIEYPERAHARCRGVGLVGNIVDYAVHEVAEVEGVCRISRRVPRSKSLEEGRRRNALELVGRNAACKERAVAYRVERPGKNDPCERSCGNARECKFIDCNRAFLDDVGDYLIFFRALDRRTRTFTEFKPVSRSTSS